MAFFKTSRRVIPITLAFTAFNFGGIFNFFFSAVKSFFQRNFRIYFKIRAAIISAPLLPYSKSLKKSVEDIAQIGEFRKRRRVKFKAKAPERPGAFPAIGGAASRGKKSSPIFFHRRLFYPDGIYAPISETLFLFHLPKRPY